jgi:hypothetical protein
MVEPDKHLSKKTLGSIDMNSSRHSASSTQEGFFRKNSKSMTSKADSLGTIIQIIKSDLFQIQETINENSNILQLFTVMSKSSSISKKIKEIQESKDIKLILDKLGDESNNVELTCKNYGCSNLNELVQKLTLEVNYYDLFIKKINELFFVWNLKLQGEDNLYQDTFSKYFLIKLVLDKLGSGNQTVFTNTVDTVQSKINNNEVKSGEYQRLSEISNINDILNEYNNEENVVLKNVVNIFKDFMSKLSMNYADLITKSGKKGEGFDGLQFDKFMTQKLIIEKIISEKTSEINDLNKGFAEMSRKNIEFEELLTKRDKEIEDLNIKLRNARSMEKQTQEHPKDIKSLMKVIEESSFYLKIDNKVILSFQVNDDRSNKLLEEVNVCLN